VVLLPSRWLGDALVPHVPVPLIEAAQWRALAAVLARMPPVFSWGGFECRLHREPRVDLLLCLVRAAAGAIAADRRFPDPAHGAALASIRAFLDAWYDDPRLAGIPLCWIEHDVHLDGPSPPFVQFCVDPSYPGMHRPALTPAALGALAGAGLARLAGPNPAGLARLVAVAEALPRTGRILHAGAIPHRGSAALRVLAALPIDDALGWLAAIGWPGRPADAAELLALLGGQLRRVSLQLDLDDGVGPTLAVEFALSTETGDDPRWQALMAALVARGLAEPAKARAALSWIGHAAIDVPDAAWLIEVSRTLDVKLVLRPGPDGRASWEAKA